MTAPKWLDPKVSIGNILSITAIIFGLTAGWFSIIGNVQTNARDISTIEKRQTKLEGAVDKLSDALATDRLTIGTSLTQLQSDVRYMRDSIDELKRRAP